MEQAERELALEEPGRLAARRQELQQSTRQAVGQAEELRGKSTALMRELRSVQQRGAGG